MKSDIRGNERKFEVDDLTNPLDLENPAQQAQYGALQPLLDDPEIEEIWINSPQRIFVARHGKSELTNVVLTSSQLQAIMDRILMWCGRRIDLSHPFVDARLPDGRGVRVVNLDDGVEVVSLTKVSEEE